MSKKENNYYKKNVLDDVPGRDACTVTYPISFADREGRLPQKSILGQVPRKKLTFSHAIA